MTRNYIKKNLRIIKGSINIFVPGFATLLGGVNVTVPFFRMIIRYEGIDVVSLFLPWKRYRFPREDILAISWKKRGPKNYIFSSLEIVSNRYPPRSFEFVSTLDKGKWQQIFQPFNLILTDRTPLRIPITRYTVYNQRVLQPMLSIIIFVAIVWLVAPGIKSGLWYIIWLIGLFVIVVTYLFSGTIDIREDHLKVRMFFLSRYIKKSMVSNIKKHKHFIVISLVGGEKIRFLTGLFGLRNVNASVDLSKKISDSEQFYYDLKRLLFG